MANGIRSLQGCLDRRTSGEEHWNNQYVYTHRVWHHPLGGLHVGIQFFHVDLRMDIKENEKEIVSCEPLMEC